MWLELEIIFTSRSTIYEGDDEDDTIKKIRLKNQGDDILKKASGFFNIASDPIMYMTPAHYIDGETSFYFTEITFESGNTFYVSGKPTKIREKVDQFIKENLIDEKEESD